MLGLFDNMLFMLNESDDDCEFFDFNEPVDEDVESSFVFSSLSFDIFSLEFSSERVDDDDDDILVLICRLGVVLVVFLGDLVLPVFIGSSSSLVSSSSSSSPSSSSSSLSLVSCTGAFFLAAFFFVFCLFTSFLSLHLLGDIEFTSSFSFVFDESLFISLWFTSNLFSSFFFDLLFVAGFLRGDLAFASSFLGLFTSFFASSLPLVAAPFTDLSDFLDFFDLVGVSALLGLFCCFIKSFKDVLFDCDGGGSGGGGTDEAMLFVLYCPLT